MAAALPGGMSQVDIDLMASLSVDNPELSVDELRLDPPADTVQSGQLVAPEPSRRGSHALGVLKRAWQPEEDAKLLALIQEQGPRRWGIIASHLPGRVGKQCRERWHNHLCPEVSKEDWSQEEDDLIQELVQKMGTKWSKIVKMLPGRTDNAIKNRWNSTMRKNLRRQLKGGPNAENASGLSPEVLAQATMDACEQLPVRKRGSSTTAAVATAAAIAAVTSEISREASRAQARKKRGAPKEDVIAQRSNSPECVHVHHPADNVRTQEGSRVVQSSLLASAAAEEGMPSPAKRRAALPSSSATEKLDLSLLHVVVPLGNQAAEPLAVPRPPALSMGLVNSSYMDSVWASNHLPLSPPGSLLGSALHGLLEPQLTATDCYAAPPVEISSDSALPGLSPLQSPLNFMNFATGVGLDLGDRFHHNQEAADHVLKHELSVDVS